MKPGPIASGGTTPGTGPAAEGSALDAAVRALNDSRRRREDERLARVSAACAFLEGFFRAHLSASQVLQDEGITTEFARNRVVLSKPVTGIYHDPLVILVDEQANIDCAGRSLGAHTPDRGAELSQALIAQIIEHFDL